MARSNAEVIARSMTGTFEYEKGDRRHSRRPVGTVPAGPPALVNCRGATCPSRVKPGPRALSAALPLSHRQRNSEGRRAMSQSCHFRTKCIAAKKRPIHSLKAISGAVQYAGWSVVDRGGTKARRSSLTALPACDIALWCSPRPSPIAVLTLVE
jgi:hypothetical protein